MMRRTTPVEREKIEKLLSNLKNVDGFVAGLSRELRTTPWDASNYYYSHPKLPLYAWRAFTSETITRCQLSTLLIFFSALHAKKTEGSPFIPQQVSIFKDAEGNPNPQAVQIMKSSFISQLDGFNFVSFSQFKMFMQRMNQLPLSEKQFVLIEDPLVGTITHRFNEIGFSIFSRFNTKKIRMVPSLGMMQTLINVLFREPVKINPIFGSSKGSDIRLNGFRGFRDMMFDFPEVYHPQVADDNNLAPPVDFIYHDFYHAFIAAGVPIPHRKLAIALSTFLWKKDLIDLVKTLVDMEFDAYRSDSRRGFSENSLFWYTLALSAAYAYKTKSDVPRLNRAVDELVKFLVIQKNGCQNGISFEGIEEAMKLAQEARIPGIHASWHILDLIHDKIRSGQELITKPSCRNPCCSQTPFAKEHAM